MSNSSPAPRPDGRYVQERLLGQGAMGAVYLVRDRETGEHLALKKLFRVDGKSALRIKREFRSLADFSHPNLVKVYELGHADDAWFLTMEYVDGDDLHGYLGLDAERSAVGRIDDALSALASRRAWIDETVVPAFHQLASGIHALHRAGMLHRDLKPSNVLVAADKRVVVLDFGLVREIGDDAPSLTEDGAILGTPAYMAPEQALNKPLSEATDWYAFGAMLYEALTGELPFQGSVYELIRAKLERDPEPPEAINPDVPIELSALCMALLQRDAGARPRGSEVLARLEPFRARAPLQSQSLPAGEISLHSDSTENPEPAAGFFGRKVELGALWSALREAEEGRTIVAHVRGMSGAGKTGLVEQFLDEVERQILPVGRPEALVLRSRCYEREAMPYKALDGVIDALSRHLAHANDLEVSNLLPTDIGALAQLFPVLERLRPVQQLLSMRSSNGDAVHNRHRAELALRELFGRLAARRPVVIWIDDLQWGDLDSAGILKGWLQRGVELPLLLLLSYRADEVETSECLRLFLGGSGENAGGPTRIIDVAPLATQDVHALCRHRLGARAHEQSALVERIVREAQGSPFLAAQLAALAEVKLARGDSDVNAISIGDLITQTRTLLPEEGGHVLRVLAVAGRPIAPKLALRAAGLKRSGREIVHALRRLQLVRTREVGGERLLEVYHDRVRENVQRLLSAAQSEQIHGSLLSVLEYSGRADPDWLHALALGANQRVAAYRYGLAAAERAMTTLAFERASELYARCLELSDAPPEQRGELLRKLAQALDCGGRGSRAADAYLAAAQLAHGSDAVELTRLAASHLLRSGRFEEGEAMLQRVLHALDLNVPKSDAGLVAAIAWERSRMALRGLHYTPRSEAEVPAALLARIDACIALRHESAPLVPARSALFLARGMRLALEAGEPMRVLLGLTGMSFVESMGGSARSERRTDQLLAQIDALAEKIGTPSARAAACVARALASWMLGRSQAVLAPSYEAERLYRTLAASRFDGNYYMRLAVTSARIGALQEMGNHRTFIAELEPALHEARSTENIAAQLNLALNETLRDELCSRSELSVERLDRQRSWLPAVGFGTYHMLHMIAVCYTAVASGRDEWGMRYLEQDWPRFERAPARRSANIAHYALAARARLLLDHHSKRGELSGVRSAIAAQVEQLARSPLARGVQVADLLRSRLAYTAGDKALAERLLRRLSERGIAIAESEGARYALGTLTGGDEGAALCAASEAAMREHGLPDSIAYLRGAFPELYSTG